MRSIRRPILGLFFVFCLSSPCAVEAKLPAPLTKMIKQALKLYLKRQGRNFVYKHCMVHLRHFDMEAFEQQTDGGQIVVMHEFITQYLITDGYIAWELGLLKCTVQNIHRECGDDTQEMARRLVAKVRKMNFIKHHWGKLLVGAGVGAAAVAAIGLCALNQFINH